MTTRYRVEYALKTHRRDQFIEWIKGLLAVPFVLHSQPTTVYEENGNTSTMVATARRRYEEIMLDIEALINDHRTHQANNTPNLSKLKFLVPTIGRFFTPLALRDAFVYQDDLRAISTRRFVAPSFNDVRLILNTAQVLSLTQCGPPGLITFDGDVTLYDDGKSLDADNPVIPRILHFLAKGTRVGIVTAAGYTEAEGYHGRLHGLLDAIDSSKDLSEGQKTNMIVMGGESNYLFQSKSDMPHKLAPVPRDIWALEEMTTWTPANITTLLDVAESALRDCIRTLRLDAIIIRKDRAVGLIPTPSTGRSIAREQLEETVLVTQKVLDMSDAGSKVPFCAFNGGSDVFVDIGDKSYGVAACQRFFGGVEGQRTLHVGDQFLSAGANDFKARLACTTAWIASPKETVELLDEMAGCVARSRGESA